MQRGIQKKRNYLLGGGGPASTGFPCYVSVLGIHLYQCTSWHCCERLCLALVNFFLKAQCVCPFHDGWFTSLHAHILWVFGSFWPKPVWLPNVLPSLHTWSHPKLLFFVSLDEKCPQRETFCWYGRCNINDRSTKRHQNWQVQKLIWSVEKKFW